ncbi:MAG: hypothetical protein QXT45_02450 [Candidatus Bilamarchaeaceae archaeon]
MNGFLYILIILFSFFVTFVFSVILIPRLKRFGITGKDVNKPDKPDVAEMGGIAIIAGFTAGVLLAIIFNTFFGFQFQLVPVLAGILTIHSLAFIGIVDDLLDVPQYIKAFLPLFAAIPLVALRATGSTTMTFPFFGVVDFGMFYIVVLVPIGIAVASNLTNMLAGFNGVEAGMGIVMLFAASLLAAIHGEREALLLFLPYLGALLAFLYFNWYPSKVFPGDVGNLTIGATLAAGVIIGNMEAAGALLLLPHVVDFFIKAYNRFPSSKWWGDYKNGRLYPLEGRVNGFAQLIMKLFNGISERNLVLFFIGLEIIVAIIVLLLYP